MYLLLFLTCGLAAVIRFQASQLNRHFPIPLGTLTVNLLAAFLMGAFYHRISNAHLYTILTAGLLGGLGTYSTLNVEFVSLLKRPKWLLLYLFLTYGLGLVLVWLGLKI